MFGLRNGLLVASCCSLLALSLPVRAEDEAVIQRLQTHGGLSGVAAKKLVSRVSSKMAKAADAIAQQSDPLRIAASQALFHTPVPPDTMAAAKMRLRLYAGLTEWSLGALFMPKPGAFAACTRDTGATQAECEALVAAAGNTSVAEARNLAGGPPMAAVAVATVPHAQSAFGAGGSHPGRFSSTNAGSNFGGSAPHAVVAPTPAPAYAAAPAGKHFGGAAAVGGPRAVGSQQQSGLSQKDAYRLQREAYMARQKAVFEERKQKLEAASAGSAEPGAAAPAVASAKPAPRSNVAAAKPAAAPPPSAAAQEAPAEPAAAAEPVAEAAPAKSNKPALDNDFLDGLLADPTGAKGKK